MSERITDAQEIRDVDQAFDPEARAAQNDWNEYLDSRPYQDGKGSLHSAENGQFMSNPNESYDADAMQSDTANVETNRAKGDVEDYYNQMHANAESAADNRFDGKSLKGIAEMVYKAKQAGDKTLEHDARAAFDDKFMETAEKYDWQGVVENADGTTTDRNAIANQKLAYYEAIMAGEVKDSNETVSQTEKTEETSEESEKTPSIEGDSQEEKSEEYVSKHRAEHQDEDTPIGDAAAHAVGADDGEAKEDESREEYEARQPGRHRADTGAADLEILDEDEDNKTEVSADDLEILDENDPKENTGRAGIRGRNWVRNPLASAGGAMTGFFGGRAEDRAERGRRGRLSRGLGAAALLIGGGLLLMKGHDIFGYLNDSQGNGGGNGGGNGNGSGQGNGGGNGGGNGNGSGHEILKSVRVKPGDGEIKVTQSILEQQGIHVNTTDAQRIGEHANVDLLLRDNNYNDAQSTLDRIGATPGTYKVRPGSAEALVKSARELGFKR